jgi:hypothetical protein
MSTISTEQLQGCSTDGSIADTVSALVEIVNEQAEYIDDLEDRLSDEREQRGRDDAELRSRISDLEDRLDDVEDGEISAETPTPDGEESGSKSSETPLERVCSLPEPAVDRELSANQRRARFVAKDVEQYASKVPAGFAITSGEISTVLRAGTDCEGRTQTVSRVMDFLRELGKDDVKVVKRRGTKRVVLSEELVGRLGQIDAVDDGDNTGCYRDVGVGV